MNNYRFYLTIVVIFSYFVLNTVAGDTGKTTKIPPSSTSHEQCLKELKPFEICDFNYREVYNGDFDVSNICEEYNEKKCQEFFESPFKFAPSCESSIKYNNYSLISKKSDDLYFKIKVAERNMICSTNQSTGESCGFYKDISPIFDLTYRDIPKLDNIRQQTCSIPECNKYLLECFQAYYNYYTAKFNDDTYQLTFFKNEIDKFASNECTTEIPSPTATLSEEEQCLKELEPYEICGFVHDYVYMPYFDEYDINEVCKEYNEKNCQEFFESPYKYAPSCENLEYSIIKEKFELKNLRKEIIERNMICSTKSNGELCNFHNEVTHQFKDNFEDIEDIDSVNLQICKIPECHKQLLKYFTDSYDYYLDIFGENYADTIFLKNEINELLSDECTELQNGTITTTTNPTKQYHFDCLKELEPFEICGFDYGYKNVDLNHDEICEEYYQKNCQEFHESPFKFAPSCEKSVETHNYPLINPKNVDELKFKTNNAYRNLVCSKRDLQSTDDFCDIYDKVDLNKFHKDRYPIETIGRRICPIPECHKYLIEYINSEYIYYVNMYGENDYDAKFIKSQLDYFSSNECTELQNESSPTSVDDETECINELKYYKECGFDYSDMHKSEYNDSMIQYYCRDYKSKKCNKFFELPLKYVPSCKNHENLIKEKFTLIDYELDIAERNLICSQKERVTNLFNLELCDIHKEVATIFKNDFKEIDKLSEINREICSFSECHKYLLDYVNAYYDYYLDNNDEDDSTTVILLNAINELSSKECK